MSSKKRKYDTNYLKFGFIEATEKGQVVPKCVICLENLSNDALRPSLITKSEESKLVMETNCFRFSK